MVCHQQEGDSRAQCWREKGFRKGVAWLVTGSHIKDLRVGMRSPLQPQCRKGAPGCPLPAPLEEVTELSIPSCLPGLHSGHPFAHCCPLSEWQGESQGLRSFLWLALEPPGLPAQGPQGPASALDQWENSLRLPRAHSSSLTSTF